MSDDDPYAEITQERGWLFRWSVIVCHGIGVWGPDGRGRPCITRRGAEREARRMLREYLVTQAPKPTSRVTVADLEDGRG